MFFHACTKSCKWGVIIKLFYLANWHGAWVQIQILGLALINGGLDSMS